MTGQVMDHCQFLEIDRYLRPKFDEKMHWRTDPMWSNLTMDNSTDNQASDESGEQQAESKSWSDASEDGPEDEEINKFAEELDKLLSMDDDTKQ